MSLLSVNNIQEYRTKYADALQKKETELGKPITDEMLTKAIYKKIASKADVDYFSFYKSFNPEGKYANIDTYRVATNNLDANDNDMINQAYDELSGVGRVRFKDFVNVFAPKPFDKEQYYDDFNIVTLNIPDTEYNIKEIAEIRGINPETEVNLREIGFGQALARDDVDKAIVAKKI